MFGARFKDPVCHFRLILAVFVCISFAVPLHLLNVILFLPSETGGSTVAIRLQEFKIILTTDQWQLVETVFLFIPLHLLNVILFLPSETGGSTVWLLGFRNLKLF